MKLTIRLMYDDTVPGPHDVEIQADITRDEPAAEAEAAAQFVGDVLHFARPGTLTVATERFRLTTNPEAADDLPALPTLNQNPHEPDRCARLSCGHDRTDHSDVSQGRVVGTHNGTCTVCMETGVESPACWSYVPPMDRPIMAAGQKIAEAGAKTARVLGVQR